MEFSTQARLTELIYTNYIVQQICASLDSSCPSAPPHRKPSIAGINIPLESSATICFLLLGHLRHVEQFLPFLCSDPRPSFPLPLHTLTRPDDHNLRITANIHTRLCNGPSDIAMQFHSWLGPTRGGW
ncbi:hypothetical protein FPOAC1_004397 [Fusarium poae]|uniref:hypothetical protein n=1 Tax=Fusarium poae TaxID=36050 RepID=UPI001CEA7644|nr:hypothetical protein FPOAC1_004397 [Fusarium poae]KAG8671158.1 hypothetical protein FPOAC1_004397 [Fusarium poae]